MIKNELIELIKNVYLKKQKEGQASPELEEACKQQNLTAFLYKVYPNYYKKYYMVSKLKNELYNEDISLLIEAFNKNQIHHVLMKGYYLKRFYSDEALRVMGDVDILIFEEDYLKAVKIIKELNYKECEKECEHHREFSNNRINVELHKKLIPASEKRGSVDFTDWRRYLVIENNYTYHFNDSYHFLYVLIHYVKHFKMGTGIRPIIDLFVLYTRTNIDKDWLEEKIKEANLTKFYHIVLASFETLFDFKVIDNVDSDLVDILLDYSIESWMNGRNPNKDADINKFLADKDGKFLYMIKKLFPSYNKLKYHFPFIKYKILCPIAYIINPFRLLFTKFFQAIKIIKTNKKDNIYRKVGI